jgi:hypothetical protein
MTHMTLDAVTRALDFIGMPYALEALDDLAHGRSPYERDADRDLLDAAVEKLCSMRAAFCTTLVDEELPPDVKITPGGLVLYERLAEIDAADLMGELAADVPGDLAPTDRSRIRD